MGKLGEAIRQRLRREARPIGFATVATARHTTMLVIARAGTPVEIAAADAVLTSGQGGGPAPLWGSDAPVAGRDGSAALADAGASFLVFDAETTPASALLDERLEYVLRVSLDAGDTVLRTIESLPLAALIVPVPSGPLTVQRTLDLRRITAFARKPLLLPVEAGISAMDLEALRDCGVAGVIVEHAEGAAVVRATIEGLPPRRREDGRGPTVALRARGGSYQVEEPEEAEEE